MTKANWCYRHAGGTEGAGGIWRNIWGVSAASPEEPAISVYARLRRAMAGVSRMAATPRPPSSFETRASHVSDEGFSRVSRRSPPAPLRTAQYFPTYRLRMRAPYRGARVEDRHQIVMARCAPSAEVACSITRAWCSAASLQPTTCVWSSNCVKLLRPPDAAAVAITALSCFATSVPGIRAHSAERALP